MEEPNVLVTIREDYLCPITREPMRDPVIAADGHSYEKNAIEEWFRRGNIRSPMTGQNLPHRTLTPNIALRRLIQTLLQSMPTLQRQQLYQTDLAMAIQLREKDIASRKKQSIPHAGLRTQQPSDLKEVVVHIPDAEPLPVIEQAWWKRQQQLWETASKSTEVPMRFTPKMKQDSIAALLKTWKVSESEQKEASEDKCILCGGMFGCLLMVGWSIGLWQMIEMEEGFKDFVFLYFFLGGMGLIGMLSCIYKCTDDKLSILRYTTFEDILAYKLASASEIRQALIKGLTVDLPVMKDILMLAIADNKADILDLLLFLKMEVNFIYQPTMTLPTGKEFLKDSTPLTAIIFRSKNPRMLRSLLTIGISLPSDILNQVLTVETELANKIKMVKLLLAHRVSITIKDLEYAWDHLSPEIAQLLEQYNKNLISTASGLRIELGLDVPVMEEPPIEAPPAPLPHGLHSSDSSLSSSSSSSLHICAPPQSHAESKASFRPMPSDDANIIIGREEHNIDAAVRLSLEEQDLAAQVSMISESSFFPLPRTSPDSHRTVEAPRKDMEQSQDRCRAM